MSDKHVEADLIVNEKTKEQLDAALTQESAATMAAPEERVMIKTIDAARLEGESFEDYKKRQAATNKLLKKRLRGVIISPENYPKHLIKVKEKQQMEEFVKRMRKDTK